jgi:hypothetical protein
MSDTAPTGFSIYRSAKNASSRMSRVVLLDCVAHLADAIRKANALAAKLDVPVYVFPMGTPAAGNSANAWVQAHHGRTLWLQHPEAIAAVTQESPRT